MLMSFDARHVLNLLELAERCPERRYTFEQLADPAFLRADLDPDRRQALEEMTTNGICWNARPEDLDPRKVPPGLILVGDEGVYLLANVPHDIAVGDMADKGGHVAYAREADPRRLPFEAWYAAKTEGFGGDDGTEFLDGAGLRPVLEDCVRLGEPFRMEITPDSIGLIVIEDPGGPET